VPAGEVVALLGPSGSGKTTLLRAIAGLETPHSGSIAIGDNVFFDAARGIELPAEQRGLGLVFQSYALWPHRTVFDNVAYGLKLRKVPAAEIKTRVEKTLSQIGLGQLAARYPHQLSGGQQQRVAIARALVYEPPVILLDEPLSNLDAKLREEARAWLRTLIVTLGLSAIHVTHDQVEAMAIADRVVLLDAGVIAQEGSPTTLYNDPATLFAAEFMGSNNRLDGKLVDNSGGRAAIELFGERLTGQSRTKAAIGAKVTGIIRIERVHCASSAGPNRLKMELKAPMYLGERWELVFARESLTVRAYASAPLEPGEHYVEFPPEALWVF
jgi:iron(III) transport system ATP-binding protein